MHWLHSADQLVNHIGGQCHTVDEYYRVLSELLEDRLYAILSAFSESKRSESAVLLADETIKDKNETAVNRLRAEANILQNASRSIIASPALEAAKVEVHLLRVLILKINDKRMFKQWPDPIAHQKIQFFESLFDLHWKAYVEFISFGHFSLETNAQFLARNISFDCAEIDSRDSLYKYLNETIGSSIPCMTAGLVTDLLETVNKELENCEPMQQYLKAFETYRLELDNEIRSVAGKSLQIESRGK